MLMMNSKCKSLRSNNDGLKIVLITQGISRVVNPLVESRHNIVGIVESAPRNKHSLLYKSYRSIKGFVGKLACYCRRKKIPYFYMKNGCDHAIETWLKKISPDIIVVYSMSELLKTNIYSIPPKGTINLHPSYLPEYRGPNPDFWQYYDMEMRPGISVHYLDAGEDTGDVIIQKRIDITLGIKSPDRLDHLVGVEGSKLLIKALNAIKVGDYERIKQKILSPTNRARNLVLEEHPAIVDWVNWPIEKVWHVLRGSELWLNALPQPKGFFRGQRWVIENLEMCESNNATLGEIYNENGKYYVAVKNGRIYLSLFFNLKAFVLSFLR